MTSQPVPINLLWAVGLLQPVSSAELFSYLSKVTSLHQGVSSVQEFQTVLMAMRKKGFLVRVMREPDLFSLSLSGTHALSPRQRKTRDRERIFLLRACQSARVRVSREEQALGSGGVAPPHNLRTRIEGSGASELGPSDPRVRTRWPRHSKQLKLITGSSPTSRDTFLDFLSFGTESELNVARSGEKTTSKYDFIALGLMLGLTPQLLVQIYVKLGRHYRTFLLPKNDGTFRTIQSPKVYLKTIQRFICDYIICDLPVHSNVYSFKNGHSSVSNASVHVGQKWVSCIDIIDFFGSISTSFVENLLIGNGFDFTSSRIIAGLTTYLGKLPQGAPSSPLISNAFLYTFDCKVSRLASDMNVRYSRYADDITISGSSRQDVELLVQSMTTILFQNYAMKINQKKTRYMSDHSQQLVTGTVVNNKAVPPRRLRRQIRAAAFNAKNSASITRDRYAEISGYISYLNSFPSLSGSAEVFTLWNDLQQSNLIRETETNRS